ncbi:methylated-DNA--[protein]-cysteine S-methyltransferase [Cochlodiniinecator piscidefendens]|uniref:methylated-DNA--[protein]-cysteine S-methyltransferase n=1 Tax=Cochlodiniinecator piscidefendens TaxID=2715756 RepID=UPI001409356C|nr:methylated-DNA--[protein]-cysteine S-methyltransferase [Cochlodiniinecator piscidefendens]
MDIQTNIGVTHTPIGHLGLVEKNGAITQLLWDAKPKGELTEVLRAGLAQLDAYFAGTLTQFDLPMWVEGTNFQRVVCDAMFAIPFGETLTYGDIAKQIGASAQAVGNACGANPIPVIIPCHRVLGAQNLGGFSGAGGVEMKVTLLKHEGAAGLLI